MAFAASLAAACQKAELPRRPSLSFGILLLSVPHLSVLVIPRREEDCQRGERMSCLSPCAFLSSAEEKWLYSTAVVKVEAKKTAVSLSLYPAL